MTIDQKPKTAQPEPGEARRGWAGPGVGAAVGLLVVAVALAFGQLVADFVSGDAAPVIAVGQVVVDRSPEWLKSFAIRTFGAHDKPVLVGGIVIVLIVLAAVMGVIATRHRWVGFAAISVLGALGMFAALSRAESDAAWALPSLAAVAVGCIAYSVLSRAAASAYAEPAAGPSPSSSTDDDDAAAATDSGALVATESPSGLARRRFLIAAGVTALGAAFAAGIARAARSRLLAGSVSRATVTIPPPASPAPTLPPAAAIHVPGVSPFYTPVDSFYRVDTSLFPPQIAASQWHLRIHGMVDREIVLSYDELLRRPLIERDVTLACVSNPVGGHYIGNARWVGTLLAPLLQEAGVHPEAQQLLSRSPDGMTIGTPTAVVMDGRDAMLAVSMNGEPLPVEHGFPVRTVVPGLYGYVSATKWVVDMELTTFAAYDAYWVQQGWAQQGPIRTQSRIDVPRNGSHVSAGTVPVAGIAWAQHTGIAGVQVRVDGGPWHQARLSQLDTLDTWRQWVYDWEATAGKHQVQVRATDDSGYTQTAREAPPFPSGATGWHTVDVSVG
ncbi:MAG TPA: molybdopterin-dependent oxidoreductase [Actinomycetota bacterium]|jgi:DMSO/TMAO reductase YedYZ molybdopterin-dependent catalytic subunit